MTPARSVAVVRTTVAVWVGPVGAQSVGVSTQKDGNVPPPANVAPAASWHCARKSAWPSTQAMTVLPGHAGVGNDRRAASGDPGQLGVGTPISVIALKSSEPPQ